MRDITEILMHWQAGRSVRQIARSLGVDRPLAETGDYRSTVRKYVRLAASLGYQPKQTNLSAQEWAVILEQQAPALSTAPPRSTVFGEIANYHEKIETDLQTNSASTIWQPVSETV